ADRRTVVEGDGLPAVIRYDFDVPDTFHVVLSARSRSGNMNLQIVHAGSRNGTAQDGLLVAFTGHYGNKGMTVLPVGARRGYAVPVNRRVADIDAYSLVERHLTRAGHLVGMTLAVAVDDHEGTIQVIGNDALGTVVPGNIAHALEGLRLLRRDVRRIDEQSGEELAAIQ